MPKYGELGKCTGKLYHVPFNPKTTYWFYSEEARALAKKGNLRCHCGRSYRYYDTVAQKGRKVGNV